MLIAVYSPHGTYDARFLANYAFINLIDPITRSPGIGQVQVFGAGQYAMRLWVKPDQLAKLGITVTEIVNAVQSQNTVNPAGRVGGEPIPPGQQFAYAVRAQGRLVSPEEFGEIVVRESPQGGVVRVKDVARVELGAQDYSVAGRLNGKPSAIVAVYQLPGSNAVDAANGVKKLMAEMKSRFPSDMDYTLALDSTRSVVEGMKEIIITLLIAIGLVIMVVYLFLARMARYSDSPAGGAGLSGRHVRVLSVVRLFHQHTLAIWFGAGDWPGGGRRHRGGGSGGTSHRRRHGSERCGLESHGGNFGPVVGIALVLSAVFVPTAFIPGITGRLYQQFAVTIAISVLLSAFNALTLSPALAALLLRPKKASRGLLRRFFDWFNRLFERVTNGYVRVCAALHSQECRGFHHAGRVRRRRLVFRR